MDYASESGRFYRTDGSPAYLEGGKKTTLHHCKKLGLVPSVTEIIKLLPKPQLEIWKQRQVMMAALTLPRIEGESEDSFAYRLMNDSQAQASVARERGKRLHGAIECALKGKTYDPEWTEHIDNLKAEFKYYGLDFHAGRTEKSFACPLGFGGSCDWHTEKTAPRLAVVDFKNKPTIEDGKRYAWDEQCIQLSAYAHGLEMPEADCINMFVGVEDGRVNSKEWSQAEKEKGWRTFIALHNLWCVTKDYEPSFDKP